MSDETQKPQDQTQAANPATPAEPKARQKPQPQPRPAAQAAAPAPSMQLQAPRFRNEVSFRHDVFKTDVQKCIRNTSFKALHLERVDVDHVHIYHSHSNQGKKLSRTGQAVGHWHDVEHYVCPKTGATSAKCGPAMHKIQKVSKTGMVYEVTEQVSFEIEVTSGPNAGQTMRVVDNHTHELHYVGSEQLSQKGIQEAQQADRAAAAAMGVSLGADAVKDNTPPPMAPTDGATIV